MIEIGPNLANVLGGFIICFIICFVLYIYLKLLE